jgi:hypothetical protein
MSTMPCRVPENRKLLLGPYEPPPLAKGSDDADRIIQAMR